MIYDSKINTKDDKSYVINLIDDDKSFTIIKNC